MNLKQIKKEKDDKNEEPEKITKLAIGKEGGAAIPGDDYEFKIEVNCLACKKTLPYEQDEDIKKLVDYILNASSENQKKDKEEWELKILPCEHSLTLQQNEGLIVEEKSLDKCKDCELKKNLWLCLTCGNLACGRKETGGNLHAIEHYNKTKHPLVVKYGTLSPDEEPSLYCYACDNDVKDEYLDTHLQNLGIDIKSKQKTDKTVTEMNLDINLNFTLSKTIEEGKVLPSLYGPGFTGLENLGNSCYMNSIIQILFNLEPFKKRYYENAIEHLSICTRDSTNCFLCQMSKLSYGLHSGLYSKKKTRHLPPTDDNKEGEIEEYQDGIRPSSFKYYFGKGNKDFSSNKQQDAFEYLFYLLEKIQSEEKKYKEFNPMSLFEFDMEIRRECNGCNVVKYENTRTWYLPLSVDNWKSKIEATEKCTMDEVLSKFLSPESIEIDCPFCKKKTLWSKTQRVLNYPKYLIIVFQRFEFDKEPIKLEVSFEPTLDKFDLNTLSQPHKKENEKSYEKELELQKEKEKEKEKEKSLENEKIKEDKKEEEDMEEVDIEFNQENVNYLMQCGVPELGAKWALYLNNHDPEVALGFYCENTDNPEYQKPLPKIKVKKDKNKKVDEENLSGIDMGALNNLLTMNFSRKKSINALKVCNNNFEEALNLLLTDPNPTGEDNEDNKNENEKKEEEKMEIEEEENKKINEGNGSIYNMEGFITHLGKNTHHGHYVSHVRQKDNKWTYFNDMKVALWEDPLIQKGYIYFYKNLSNDNK